jgi:CRISPR-associated protein Cst2
MEMNKLKGLTVTVLARMTANYSDSLGNVASVQKVFREGQIYSIKSRESLKNAVMVQSGMYNDLGVTVDGATQKEVSEEMNASNCRALESGYMNTKVGKDKLTYIRNSSFYFTDAIACEPFINEPRFHNNLHLASTYAKAKGLNVQNNAGEVGLMPYNYEYDKSLRAYSVTFDLEMIGKDDNFGQEAELKEKADRVIAILETIENLSLTVKGNLDNAEPIFVIGGLSNRKTHVFENVIRVKDGKFIITDDLLEKKNLGYNAGLLKGESFVNENEIIEKLTPVSITKFFDELKTNVKEYYGVV